MNEIRKIKIDKEFVVKIKGEIATNLTDEKATETLDNLHKSLKEIISQIVGEDIVLVEPVKHGEWITIDDTSRCSECGYIPAYDSAIDDLFYSPFCPNCGAKMDG